MFDLFQNMNSAKMASNNVFLLFNLEVREIKKKTHTSCKKNYNSSFSIGKYFTQKSQNPFSEAFISLCVQTVEHSFERLSVLICRCHSFVSPILLCTISSFMNLAEGSCLKSPLRPVHLSAVNNSVAAHLTLTE